MAAVVSGMFTVFIKSETGDENLAPMEPTGDIGGSVSDKDFRLGNGAIMSLGMGEDIVSAKPERPNAQFDPFVVAILRSVGASLGMPYEILIKQFNSSYSASRAAMLEAWRFFMARRQWLARNMCQPVYEAWLMEAVARRRVVAPGFNSNLAIRQAYCGCEWVGTARGQIDESKEMDAAQKRIDLGISTLAKESREITGTDWKQNIEQRKREAAKRKDAGLGEVEAPKPGPQPTQNEGDNENEQNEDSDQDRGEENETT